MADVQSPAIRRWYGKARVAAVWTEDLEEIDLRLPGANCSIYTSDDQQLRGKPSFKVPFDRLVTHSCKPLLSSLILNPSSRAHAHDPSKDIILQLKEEQASDKVDSAKSTCFLVLTPPTSYNADETQQYNLTTRNFFAWIAGAPIVGTDPASALVALKLRMDMWRASSCDNIAAVIAYGENQSYGDLALIRWSLKNELRDIPSMPTDYQLVSTLDDASALRRYASKATRIRMSLRRHTAPILKRQNQDTDPNDTAISARESALLFSSSQAEGIEDLVSGTLPDSVNPAKLGDRRLSLVSTSHPSLTSHPVTEADNFDDDSVSTRGSSGGDQGNTSSPDTVPDLPELDGNQVTQSNESIKPSSDTHNQSEETQEVADISSNAPTTVEPPRLFSSAPQKRSASTNRKVPITRSRPPSPIQEEVIPSTKLHSLPSPESARTNIRRYSYPSKPSNIDTILGSTTSLTSVHTADTAHSKHERPLSVASVRLASGTRKVCTTCNRSKPPGTVKPQQEAEGIPGRSMTPIAEWKPTDTRFEIMTQLRTPSRHPSGKGKGKAEQEKPDELVRFPSLHNLRIKPAHGSVSPLPKDAATRILSASLHTTPPTKSPEHRSTRSDVSTLTRQLTKRSITSTPLSEQRYEPSMRSESPIEYRAPQALIPSIPIELPASTKRPEELLSAKQDLPFLQPVTPIDVEISPWLLNAVMVKANGSKVSLALNLDDETPPKTATTQAQDDVTRIESNELLLDQLLGVLKVIEAKNHLNRSRSRRYTKPIARSESQQSTIPSIRPPTRRSIISTASKHLSWPGSLMKWQQNSRTSTPVTEIHRSPSSLTQRQPTNKGGALEYRVLSLDRDGKFSTIIVDSPTEEVLRA